MQVLVEIMYLKYNILGKTNPFLYSQLQRSLHMMTISKQPTTGKRKEGREGKRETGRNKGEGETETKKREGGRKTRQKQRKKGQQMEKQERMKDQKKKGRKTKREGVGETKTDGNTKKGRGKGGRRAERK